MSKYVRPREKIIFREYDKNALNEIKKQLNISESFAKILLIRGLVEFENSKLFFNPSLDNLNDPFLFKQMNTAIDRIIKAKENGEKILIYGDYDVDGITAVSLLWRVFDKIGINVECYLPNRLTEGYGISKNGIDHIIKNGVNLIISVDCGVTAVEEVDYANQNGIDVIITDHHEPKDEIPNAIAIINPKISGENYPDKNLAGVGVALKLAQALCVKLETKEYWKDELDLAAFGTAADIVPLIGENRIIASVGYKKMQENPNVGLGQLIEIKRMNGKEITTGDIVFKLSPAVNAAGRLGDPKIGVKLFLSDDKTECRSYAEMLVLANMQRKDLEEKVSKEAFEIAQNTIDFDNELTVVAAKEGWHMGIVGIVASRLVDWFCRPAALFSIDEEGIAHGSVRTFGKCDVLTALTECGDVVLRFGGHKSAAGLSIKAQNIQEFRKRFNAAVKKQMNIEDLTPIVYADTEIFVSQLTPKFFENLKRMEPFGPSNMRPVFVAKNLNNKFPPKAIGKDLEHVKLYINGGGYSIDAVGFGFGDRVEEIQAAQNFTICFVLAENTYMGKTELQMEIRGIEV